VVAALIGIGFNSIRGNSEAKVELSRQYHPADVMKLQNNGASATEALNRESAEQSGVDTSITESSQKSDSSTAPPETSQPAENSGTSSAVAGQNPSEIESTSTETPEENVSKAQQYGLQEMGLADCEGFLGEDIAVFVDARKRDDYESGHIPGAVHLGYNTVAEQIDDLRPQLEQAFFIIVYCNGGNCEDSINLALDLISVYGLMQENVYVFEGGIEEWTENGLSLTKGANP